MQDYLLDQFNIPLGFGGAAVSGEGGGYGFGDVSEDQANELLNYAFEKGIRLFDTAPIYGFGLSEKRMGKAFKKNREKVTFISKSGVTWHPNQRVDMTNNPDVTQKMLEQSLRDLETEYIDIYMIHWPDNNVDIRRPMEVLAKAKNEGKIKHIGLCNTYPEDYQKAKEVERVEVVQSQLNPFDSYVENEMANILKEDRVSFMSWGTLDKGILTKRVDRNRTYDDSDCRSWAPWWDKKEVAKKVDAMESVFDLLEKNDRSGLEFAIQHNLKKDFCQMVLVGMKNQKYIDTTIEAVQTDFSSDLLEESIKQLKENYRV